MGEKQLRLPCNLGYRHALQTGLKFASRHRYDVVVCFDADGQHHPEDVPRLVQTLAATHADVVIGSRYCGSLPYDTSVSRRLGQLIFSHLTRVLIGRRIYDTTSGFKVLRATAYEAIVDWTFLDFHIETLVHLSWSGFTIVECPITFATRAFGRSMHSFTSIFRYPLQALLLAIVAVVDALLTRRSR
jgi:glycosyltransferase involved in cell wall biosynthesis